MARVRFRLPFILAAGLLVNLWLTGPALGQNPLDWLFEDRRATPFRPGKAHPSHLNEGQGLQATEKGEGTLGIPGPNRRLTAATVTLSARGKAEILLTGERTYRLAGTWQRGRAQDILIDLTDTFARSPASGGGTLTLTDNASFHRIDLKGESAALGGDFNMHFEANSTAPNPRPRFSLDATENGRSSMGVSGPNRRLSQARAILERDGRARCLGGNGPALARMPHRPGPSSPLDRAGRRRFDRPPHGAFRRRPRQCALPGTGAFLRLLRWRRSRSQLRFRGDDRLALFLVPPGCDDQRVPVETKAGQNKLPQG